MICLFYIYYAAGLFIIISVYLLTLIRLHYSFKNSVYELDKATIVLHVFIMILFHVLWAAHLILELANNDWYIMIFALLIIIFLFGYAQLIFQFNHSLFKLVLKQRSTIFGNNNSKELNIRQKSLIQTIVKQTLLASGTFIALIVVCIIYIISIIADPKRNSSALLILRIWMIWLLLIGNAIFLSLSFGANTSTYNKLCGRCHTKCDKSFQSRASKYILSRPCSSMTLSRSSSQMTAATAHIVSPSASV